MTTLVQENSHSNWYSFWGLGHTLARIAGHSSITITQRYCHPQAEAIQTAFQKLSDAGTAERTAPATVRVGQVPESAEVIEKMVSAEGIESTIKRILNDMQVRG